MHLGKKKSDLVAQILTRVATSYGPKTDITATKFVMRGAGFNSQSSIHNFYKQHFNFVDIADRYWYQVAESHINHKWQSKMLLCFMRHLLLNVWVLSPFKTWQSFRADLAMDLLHFQEDVSLLQ